MRLMIALCMSIAAAAPAWAEDVTITTYYPSPRGVYDELRTSGNTLIGNVAGAPAARLQVVNQPGVDAFRVSDDGTVGDPTPFIVKSNGWVGIGTWQPIGPLSLRDGDGDWMKISAGDNCTGTTFACIQTNGSLAIGPTQDLTLGEAGSRVTVGGYSTARRFNVLGDAWFRDTVSLGADANAYGPLYVTDVAGIADQMVRLSTTGGVILNGGTGGVTPGYYLDVNGNALTRGTARVRQNAYFDGQVGIKTLSVDPLVDLAIGRPDLGFRAGLHEMVFRYNGIDRVYFTDAGKIGIGYNPGPGFFADLVVDDPVEVRAPSNNDGHAAYYVQNTNVGWFWQLEHMLNGDYAFRNNSVGGVPVVARLDPAGNFFATSKNFDIPHPLDPAGRRLIHSAVEGPEVAVFYRGQARLTAGRATVALPPYFEALTRKEGRTVQLTPQFAGEEPASALAASAVADGGFSVRAMDARNPDQAFYWEVKAVRADVAPLQVERSSTPEEASNAP